VTITAAPAQPAKVAVICYPSKNIDIIELRQLHEEKCLDLGSMPNFVSKSQLQAVPSIALQPTVLFHRYLLLHICIIIVAVNFVYFWRILII